MPLAVRFRLIVSITENTLRSMRKRSCRQPAAAFRGWSAADRAADAGVGGAGIVLGVSFLSGALSIVSKCCLVRRCLCGRNSFRRLSAVAPLSVERLEDRARATDDVPEQLRLGRVDGRVKPGHDGLRQPARGTDARGAVRVHHGILLGLGEAAERVGVGRRRRVRSGAGTEISLNQ